MRKTEKDRVRSPESLMDITTNQFLKQFVEIPQRSMKYASICIIVCFLSLSAKADLNLPQDKQEDEEVKFVKIQRYGDTERKREAGSGLEIYNGTVMRGGH